MMDQLLDSLRVQHQSILSWLGFLRNWVAVGDSPQQDSLSEWTRFLDAYALAVKTHHDLEERILFQALHAIPELNQGGPRCTHFMGLLILDNPAETLRESLRIPLLDPHIPPELATFFASHSPLRIPLEEHIVGELALMELRRRVQAGESGASLQSLVHDYARLMDQHISKEDTCLFVRTPVLLARFAPPVDLDPAILDDSLGLFSQAARTADETMGRLLEASLK